MVVPNVTRVKKNPTVLVWGLMGTNLDSVPLVVGHKNIGESANE